ncbi:hypothetical protein Ccrd_017864 [Cynara cardunculus var. scolymus]|uniref:Uncharacterized protein n=1 Tax=Cynara cardunculus var. scolymus TaxID=59895 RepID=A0A103Y7A1_CYNCS|nr:hypothetical protein Ccrd_017864 [Cynara cardunculus var. scolymus]
MAVSPFSTILLSFSLTFFFFFTFTISAPSSSSSSPDKSETFNPRKNGEFVVEFMEYICSSLSMARIEMGFHKWISINVYGYIFSTMVESLSL